MNYKEQEFWDAVFYGEMSRKGMKVQSAAETASEALALRRVALAASVGGEDTKK